jgi:hypothetical protein
VTMEQTRPGQKSAEDGKKALSIAPFAKGVHAVRAGQPCAIAAVGDLEGYSPAYLVIDQQGQSQWVRQSEVTITDPDFLPLGKETAQAIATALNGRR